MEAAHDHGAVEPAEDDGEDEGHGEDAEPSRAWGMSLMALVLGCGAGHFGLGRDRPGTLWLGIGLGLLLLTGCGTVFVHPYCFLAGIALVPLPRLLAAGDLLRRASNPPIVWGRTLKIWVLLFLVGTGAAYLVRIFLVEAFRLPSGSMMPTLLVGDHFAVDKLPRALVRGDLITFKWPVDPDKDFMKRVIGLEGDTVEGRDNVIFLNGQPVERKPLGTRTYTDWISDGSGPERAMQVQAEVWQESLLGRVYEVQQEPGRPPHTFPPHQVPRDAVFVMGDNRDNSSDSRVWGYVPLSLVKGKVLMVWWSEVQDMPRWSRIGMLPR